MKLRSLVGAATLAVATLLAGSQAGATVISYAFNLNGASENPANGSPGTGTGTVNYDNVAKTLAWNVSFSGLTGNTTASHFHATTALSGILNPPSSVVNVGVAISPGTLPSFPLGVTSGSASAVIDLTQTTSYTAAFLTANGGTATGAEVGFAAALAAGKTYWNIHTSTFGGGEIRGFPVAVPESTTIALAGSAMTAVAALRRRRK